MKLRDPMLISDGFEKSVAEKMPRVKREEERPFSPVKTEPPPPLEAPVEALPIEFEPEMKGTPPLPSQTRRALEVDVATSRKTIQQYAEDNRDLRHQIENLKKELQRLKDLQTETAYLKEENTDALEKIQEFQQEVRTLNEALAQVTQEREEAFRRVSGLESHSEHVEILRIKEKMREKEASQFADENRALRSKLEETLTQNIDLERKYEELKRSFNEIKESLTFLRDSCKTEYYNLPGSSS
jgi:chromosome segregation ATPase